MHSLRSPLHIPFTYQYVCAPVGAHSLRFTCFASHTLSILTCSISIPPKTPLWCSLNSQVLIGELRQQLFKVTISNNTNLVDKPPHKPRRPFISLHSSLKNKSVFRFCGLYVSTRHWILFL